MEHTKTDDFMNPPEVSPEYYETKEMLLKELEEYRKLGKHREWFQEAAGQWLEMKSSDYTRNYWKETAYEECLKENPVNGFSDLEYLELVLGVKNRETLPAICIWIVRNLLERKLVLNRNCPQVKELLSWNGLEGLKSKEEKQETYDAGILMLAECLTLAGEEEERSELHVWEKNLLQQPHTEVVVKCIKSGLLVAEKAEEYLDFILEKGARELLPVFISLKFKVEHKEESGCTQ